MKRSMRIGEAVCHPSTPFPFRVQCRRRAFISAPRVRIRLVVSYSERRNVSSTSDENSFTEGLRRKLWRTHDHGPKDLEPDDNQSVRDQETQWEEIAADKQAVEPYNATLPSVTSGDYTPATTWDGLESIGGPEGWWEETWDHNNRFEGLVLLVATGENADHHSRSFMAPHMITTREDISRAIHRAFVEIFTLKEAGLPIDISGDFVQTSQTDYIKDVSFKQAEDGTTVPVFVQEKLRKEILDSLTTEHDELNTNDPNGSLVDVLGDTQVVEDKGAISTAKTQTSALIDLGAGDLEHTESTVQTEKPSLEFAANDETWLNVHFHDIDVKFVILKRVMQLTGVRIPDPAVEGIKSGKGLHGFLAKKPKPKKLAQSLMADEALKNLPNVKMMDRRYTPIDKEKEVGRWKVIEEELIRQGLPVTGGHQQAWGRSKV